MKLSVLVAKNGKVLATMRHEAKRAAGAPRVAFTLAKGQSVHEVDLPAALHDVPSADALHKTLKRHIKAENKRKKKKKK